MLNNVMSVNFPTLIMDEIGALVKSGAYSSESDVLCDAFRVFLQHKPSTKIQVAAEMYRAGNVSLSRASEIAETDIESFKEMLSERGIKVKTAIPTVEELDEEMRYLK